MRILFFYLHEILTDQCIQLAWRRIVSLKVDLDHLQSIVATNDKKRYQIELDPNSPLKDPSAITSTTSTSNPASWRIRATQGHSITTLSEEQLFEPILLTDANCPSFVVHGTDTKSWKDIQRSGGLKPMRRKHIHFATRLPEKMPPLNPDFQSQSKPKPELADKVISGMRNTSTVIIWVDVKGSLEAGVRWWRSENEVILTEGVGEPKMLGFEWIKWVETRGSGEMLYGTKVDSAEVWEMERKMDKLGIGLEDGGEVSRPEKDAGKAAREKAIEETVPRENATDGNEEPHPTTAIKEHWDD